MSLGPATSLGRGDITSHRGWKLVLLASLGGWIEFYDFVICGIFAQFIAAAFFPTAGRTMSLVMSYGLFAVGYLARPGGGVLLGHFGDRYGRRRVFVASVFVMSASTLAIGLLPGYAEWGVWAPLVLLILRLLQGMCLGGELPGAITYVVEMQPQRPGLACGIVYSFASGGALIAAMVNWALQTHYSPSEMVDFGWRIAFVIGGVIGLSSFWLRRSLEETPAFLEARALRTKVPIREVIAHQRRAVVTGVGVSATSACFTGLLFGHMQSYLARVLDYEGPVVAAALNVALIVLTAMIIVGGWLADRVSRVRILRYSGAALMLLSIPFYSALSRHAANLTALLVAMVAVAAILNGAFPSIVADLFPTPVRYTAVGVAVNLSFTVLGGTASLVATGLIAATGWQAAPGALLSACAAIGFATSFALHGVDRTLAARPDPVEDSPCVELPRTGKSGGAVCE